MLLVRADANETIGTGHVMRCIALAQAWQDEGEQVVFVTADCTPAIATRLSSEGFGHFSIPVSPGSTEDAQQFVQIARERDAQWLAMDGYHFDSAYQLQLKCAGLHTLCIDDHGKAAPYYTDVVLNQNLHAREDRYVQRETYTQLLLGPRYVLLRRDFRKWETWRRSFLEMANKVLVTLGGSDPRNTTREVLRALSAIGGRQLEVTVVIGGSNPHSESLQQAAADSPHQIRIVKNVTDMASLMAHAEVAVTGAGTTCWEICLLGLPALLIALAPNELALAADLHRLGAGIHIGNSWEISLEAISGKLESLLDSVQVRTQMSEKARELVDAGGASRVMTFLRSGSLQKQDVTHEGSGPADRL
jgi:UDP-2,4-diacetamido-2,4,6-trideoxy-beta-L-altropyranose hydrolase